MGQTARQKQYYEENREHILARKRRHYRENRERILEEKLQYREQNRARERERVLLWYQDQGKDYKDHKVVYDAQRRASIHSCLGSFTVEEWRALQEYYGNICLCCGGDKPLTTDHIIPLSRGGLNTLSNIQPLCKPCNSRKGAKSTDYRQNMGVA